MSIYGYFIQEMKEGQRYGKGTHYYSTAEVRTLGGPLIKTEGLIKNFTNAYNTYVDVKKEIEEKDAYFTKDGKLNKLLV